MENRRNAWEILFKCGKKETDERFFNPVYLKKRVFNKFQNGFRTFLTGFLFYRKPNRCNYETKHENSVPSTRE